MVHDAIKAAARRRMAQTGEPYCLARRKVIEERKQIVGRSITTGKTVLPISPAFNAKVLQISRMAEHAAANMLAAQLAALGIPME